MISPETRVRIRHYYYAEKWKIGTIASELALHPDTVRQAIADDQAPALAPLRQSKLDGYAAFLRATLEQHPRLRATRLYQMIREAATPVACRNCVAP